MFLPLLVIDIPWSPDIFQVGRFLLTWHGLFTSIGILAGLRIALRMARLVHYDADQVHALALVGVPCGIAGARALYVAEHWSYFQSVPVEVFALNEGGISVWGAVLGGTIGAALFAKWRGYPIARGLDIASFGTVLGLTIGRLGDLVNGEHCGRATSLPWAVTYTNPSSPGFVCATMEGPAVHPATTYELFILLGLLAIMYWAFTGPLRQRPGLTFFLFVYGYCLTRFSLTMLRLDSQVIVFGLRTPQVFALLTAVACVPLLIATMRRRIGQAGVP